MLLRPLKRLLVGILISLIAGASFLSAAAVTTPQNPSGFVIKRGTNLSHWLSQDFGWAPRAVWLTENDIRFIAQQGFDHVRLPIDEKELWLASGLPNEPEFARMLTAIQWCRNAGLRVILDLHTINSHHFNAANEGLTNSLWSDPKAQAHFLELWVELSKRLRDLPVDFLAYEIMNEPVADDHNDWNRLVAAAFKKLRSLEPKRVIVIGANRWQLPANMPFLQVPAGDKNIILSIHTYSPMMLTHYLADWTPLKVYTGPVTYPGPVVDKAAYEKLLALKTPGLSDLVQGATDNWNAERIREDFIPAIKHAKELGLQLYCGEFGCLPTVPRASRLAYYRDIIAVFKAENIAWSNWEYKGDFGVFEWHGPKVLGGAPDTELLEILLAKP